MAISILATKLYTPSPRANVVLRPHLIERLNEGLRQRLTLISAPAGFGKTTLVSEWLAGCDQPVAWLSLDDGDSDSTRFLTYLVAAVQTIAPKVGERVLNALQSPQPPSIESILTSWLNEITPLPENIVLVLDDYHTVDSKPVDNALSFLIEHLPPRMHLVIASREDPHLPLARLRVRGQLNELRAVDLRFSPAEAAEFLNRVMGLNLSADHVTALETRTEGWIAGLQLAALSMQGHQDTASFIKSFTGSHHFVLDYLLEEVLQRQPERFQNFLLRTSILNRLCGPLCDAVLGMDERGGTKDEKRASDEPSSVVPALADAGVLHPSSLILESLERANLFIVPLDNERRWYRYHHLFGDLLRQRLSQTTVDVTELHIRASQWYEDNGLEFEAFHHAAAANDIDRAARLVQGKGMPLHVRGGLVPVLNWLRALPTAALDARPVLWVMFAGALTTAGQTIDVEQKLVAAETALQKAELNDETRDLLGRVANNRAVLAVSQYQADTVLVQAQRALELLRPDNLPVRTITTWALGVAYQMKGDRTAAGQSFARAISISEAIGHIFVDQLATIGLGSIQESDNQLYLAAETYRHALQLFGDQPLPIACEAHLGLARTAYEWNDLDAAEQHGRQSLELARQFAGIIDRFIISEVFLVRLMLARGNAASAAARLTQVDQIVQEHNFMLRMPEVAAAQVLILLRQGDVKAAAQLAGRYDLPISQARVHLAQGDSDAALAVLEPFRRRVEANGWADERLKAMVLQALAFDAHGEKDRAIQVIGDALALAEPGGFIRLLVDEGEPMQLLLRRMRDDGGKTIAPVHSADAKEYIDRVLAAFGIRQDLHPAPQSRGAIPRPLVEPLSERELEVLRLVAQGLSNRDIGERLFLALSTVKGHNRQIFDKLRVQSRTEAVARARELGLL